MTVRLCFFINLIFSFRTSGQTEEFNFDFRHLSKADTLYITSEIRDCGEFGGHIETIKIYLGDSIRACYSHEQTTCEQGHQSQEKYTAAKNRVVVGRDEQEYILAFMTSFKEYKDDPYSDCNAPTRNQIKYRDKTIYLNDDECIWTKSIELRLKLFGD